MLEVEKRKFFELTMQRRWKEVADQYENNWELHKAVLTKNGETALHIAMLQYNSEQFSHQTETYIDQMIQSMSEENLSIMNFKGYTPLHLAATVGWTGICRSIANKFPHLIASRNVLRETPLFMAAQHGMQEVFELLHNIYVDNEELFIDETDVSLWRRNDGNTVLHFAISGERFGLAEEIIRKYPVLVGIKNLEGLSPLHILAQKPKLFKKATHLDYWDSIINMCALGTLERPSWVGPQTTQRSWLPDNYRTSVDIFNFLLYPVYIVTRVTLFGRSKKNVTDEEKQKGTNSTNPKNVRREDDSRHIKVADKKNTTKRRSEKGHSVPANNATLIMLLKFGMNIILTILGIGIGKRKKIEHNKEQYFRALKVIDQMLKYESSYEYAYDGNHPTQSTLTKLESHRFMPPLTPPPDVDGLTTEAQSYDKIETSFLVAAKMGIHDMVERIFHELPIAIYDQDTEGMNVLMLAAKHRQTTVIDSLLKTKLVPEHIFQHVDEHGNNIVHHAAMLEPDYKPWRVPGAALQMQWEIKWFEYVKGSVPSIISSHHFNNEGKTPSNIFTKTHEELVNEGSKWLIKTSDSCSVVAALIAGAAFTTTASIPGGPNQGTGYPLFQGELAFNVFSVAALVALCLAVTSLVFFLGIITSRGVEQEFRSNLPSKLLHGLTCLFAAIVAMLVSFCASHTFILADNLKFAAIPIYSIACVPITLFALAQLPLYIDLFKVVWTKVPLRSF